MFRPEQKTGLPQENFYSFDNDFELVLTPEITEILDRLELLFNEEPGVGELFSYLKDRFGVLISRDELDKECYGGILLDNEQYVKHQQRINDVLSPHELVVYKVFKSNQMLLSKSFPFKQRVLFPERREVLIQALDGVAYDEEIKAFCKTMMSMKAGGENLRSVLSERERGAFLKLLSGPVAMSNKEIAPLWKKIQNNRYSKNFRIKNLPKERDEEGLKKYYFEKIALNRGIDLGE